MSSTEETDLGQAPIIYPEGFVKAVAEDSHRNGHASSSSGGSGSSSSNTSQTQLVQVRLEPLKPGGEEPGEGKAVLDKERHPSSSSGGKGSEVENEVVQEYYCGVGRCRPSWMQKLRDARFFTFLLCCNCFIEGALVSGRLIQIICDSTVTVLHFVGDSQLDKVCYIPHRMYMCIKLFIICCIKSACAFV